MNETPEPNASTMASGERLKAAWSQLNLVLSFFSRIDTKISVVLGINLTMLAMLAARTPELSRLTWTIANCSVAAGILIAISIVHLYRGVFPNLGTENKSLVFFRCIASMKEESFKNAFSALSEDALSEELLGQVWQNSLVLTEKFRHLRWAYRCTLTAVFPWLLVLVLAAIGDDPAKAPMPMVFLQLHEMA